MTTKQTQHLLSYLGYDVGGVDGISGPKTKEAIREFQEDFKGLTITGEADEATRKALKHAVAYDMFRPGSEPKTGTFWDEIPHFTREEFRCKCGGKYCNGYPAEPDEKLVRAAQKVREHFGVPVTVSSGLRCKTHNAIVGGVSNSRHLSGKAMDFSVRGFSADSVLDYVRTLGVNYAYAIDRDYVHMDVK